jgi:mannitol/fructose-specific phosphotransferase system IIA component (Ntr-type)
MVSERDVRVQLVFLLAADSSAGQLALLQRIVALLQSREVRERLLFSEREEQILRILAKGDQPFRGEEPW